MLGGEGIFNLSLSGNGIAVLESTVPREELIEIELDNDEVRIDGNMAVCWSKSLMAPVVPGALMKSYSKPKEEKKTTSEGVVSSIASTLFDN